MELRSEDFAGEFKGKKVGLYTLRNKNGMSAAITNQGGKLLQLILPDGADVVLGYDTLADTLKGRMEMGATIGRVANRIAKGKFNLDGIAYSLSINDGENHLHGGTGGVHTQVFDVAEHTDDKLVLAYTFKDGEEGYPGNCELKAGFILTDDNELVFTFEATTDAPTPVNFVNHAYYNLRGAGSGDILGHEMQIFAHAFTPSDATLIPTGEVRPVAGTPLDFNEPHVIGERIGENYEPLIFGRGYDHNFILKEHARDELVIAASVRDPESGRVMEVWTTEPAIQFYTGNFLDDSDFGKEGKPCGYRSAFCLETQHYPDAPNHANFPNIILKPGEKFSSRTVHKFK